MRKSIRIWNFKNLTITLYKCLHETFALLINNIFIDWIKVHSFYNKKIAHCRLSHFKEDEFQLSINIVFRCITWPYLCPNAWILDRRKQLVTQLNNPECCWSSISWRLKWIILLRVSHKVANNDHYLAVKRKLNPRGWTFPWVVSAVTGSKHQHGSLSQSGHQSCVALSSALNTELVVNHGFLIAFVLNIPPIYNNWSHYTLLDIRRGTLQLQCCVLLTRCCETLNKYYHWSSYNEWKCVGKVKNCKQLEAINKIYYIDIQEKLKLHFNK